MRYSVGLQVDTKEIRVYVLKNNKEISEEEYGKISNIIYKFLSITEKMVVSELDYYIKEMEIDINKTFAYLDKKAALDRYWVSIYEIMQN
jgi:hypothetical protein